MERLIELLREELSDSIFSESQKDSIISRFKRAWRRKEKEETEKFIQQLFEKK